MINMYNEDLSKRITNISRNMINNISAVVGKEFDELMQRDKSLLEYEIERKRQYNEISKNLQVDEKVCEFIVEMAATLPHDKDVKHYTPKGDTANMDQKDIINHIDPDCVGICTKCSLLHFVNVRYPMNKAIHMLMDKPKVPSKFMMDDFECNDVPSNFLDDDYNPTGFSDIDVASALLCEPDMSDRGRDKRTGKYHVGDITPMSEDVDVASDLLSENPKDQ